MGQPDDFSVMVTSVIDANAFNKIKKYIDEVCVDEIMKFAYVYSSIN